MIRLSLLVDDTLDLALEPELYPLAQRWIPHGLAEPGSSRARAAITVRASSGPLQRPSHRPTLVLGRAAAWLFTRSSPLHDVVLTPCPPLHYVERGDEEDSRPGGVVLRGGLCSSGGELNLATYQAHLYVDPSETHAAAADLYSLLTISAGLLLAGLERALVHAAAIVHPAGGAWLLAGDARAGKSTTCATLVAGGWGYLSDDQVVLAAQHDGVQAHGWLRPFHLDASPGVRTEIPPAEVGLESWRRTAPLAGVIFPVVEPTEPTRLESVTAGWALAGLVRQSPWLLATPRQTAPGALRLLERAVAGGAFRLSLGLDTYRAADRLAACLEALETRVRAPC